MANLATKNEVETGLKRIPQWECDGTSLERTFKFDDFNEAMDFVNVVAEIAEEEGHHPDIDIRWNRVRLVLSTHSKGGLTELDFDLAERIDAMER